MKLLGITGGIGMGKSMAGQLLTQRQVPVVDTDTLARSLVAPGQPALQEITRVFGPDLLDESGRLNRSLLARKAFGDPAARQRLEQILHPPIRAAWLLLAQQWRERGEKVGAVIIPLLFETGAESSFDQIICLACSLPTQQQRLAARGWSPEEIRSRIDSQWSIERKMERSQVVVWTEVPPKIHDAQWGRILGEGRNVIFPAF